MMLTATANPESAVAICDLLGVRVDPYLERGSLLRPNMSYSVMGVQSLMQKRPVLFGLVSEMSSSDAVIVYTSSKQRADQLAEDLREAFPDRRVRSYHADQPQQERLDTEVRWRADEVSLMVATIAFGMGVDKASVRLVVHYDLPKSVTALYQESGRAGRDGHHARHALFWTVEDWISAAQMRHGQFADTYERQQYGFDLSLKVLQWVLSGPPRRCRHVAFEADLGDGATDDVTCTTAAAAAAVAGGCAAEDVGLCTHCASSAVADVVAIHCSEWMPQLRALVSTEAHRLGGSVKAQAVRLLFAKSPSHSLPAWQCGALLGLAIMHGGLQTSFQRVACKPAELIARARRTGTATLLDASAAEAWELHLQADLAAAVPVALECVRLNAACLEPARAVGGIAAVGKPILRQLRVSRAAALLGAEEAISPPWPPPPGEQSSSEGEDESEGEGEGEVAGGASWAAVAAEMHRVSLDDDELSALRDADLERVFDWGLA